jgi:hypothetical protein
MWDRRVSCRCGMRRHDQRYSRQIGRTIVSTMVTFRRRLTLSWYLLRRGELGIVRDNLLRKLWGDDASLGLRRDMDVPFLAPDAQFPISIRPFRESDLSTILDLEGPDVPSDEIRDRMARRDIVSHRFSSCYVAVTGDDQPCFIQWAMYPSEHETMRGAFGAPFPTLADDEVLLEGAFTPGTFRGRKVMPAAMARIAECEAKDGGHSIITFVQKDNIPSLKGCERAGFHPYMNRSMRRRFFRLSVTFTPLAAPLSA